MAERVTTPLCRAAWTQHVFTPRVETKTDRKTGQPYESRKYGCTLVFDASVQQGLQEMMDAAFRVGVEAFGENFWPMVQQGSIRWPFRNGGEINPKTGQPRYEQGTTFINCSSGNPVDVVSRYCDPADPQRKPIKVTDPSQLWPGQYVKANVTFKEYKDPQWGVACYVNGLQLWHEGERWGDSFDAQEAFDAEGDAPTGQFGAAPQQGPVGQPGNPGGQYPAGGGVGPQAGLGPAPVGQTGPQPGAVPPPPPNAGPVAGGGGSSLL